MKFYIREATINDNSMLLELLSEVQKLHTENRPDIHLDTKVTFDQVYGSNIYEDPRYKIYVAVNKEQDIVTGYILLRIKDLKPQIIGQKPRKSLYIHELCVNKDYRNNGVGNQLVSRAIEFGREIDADSIELGVWEFNEDAIRFYENIGMKTKLRMMEMKL